MSLPIPHNPIARAVSQEFGRRVDALVNELYVAAPVGTESAVSAYGDALKTVVQAALLVGAMDSVALNAKMSELLGEPSVAARVAKFEIHLDDVRLEKGGSNGEASTAFCESDYEMLKAPAVRGGTSSQEEGHLQGGNGRVCRRRKSVRNERVGLHAFQRRRSPRERSHLESAGRLGAP